MSLKTDLIDRLEFTAERSCVSSAADLRAAAAAVRLVGECREALTDWRSERKREQALASISDWKGKFIPAPLEAVR